MKKLQKPLKRQLPPVKLYLDDLEEVYRILEQQGFKVKIITEEYEAENIEQLRNLEMKTIYRLSFVGYVDNSLLARITVGFYPGWADIDIKEDSIQNRGILSMIEEAVNKRRILLKQMLTKTWFHVSLGFVVGSSFVSMLAIPGIFEKLGRELGLWGLLPLAIFSLSLLLTVLSWRFSLRSYSTIILLKERRKHPSGKEIKTNYI